MKKLAVVAYQVLLAFSLLGVLFIPFSFRSSSVQAAITQFLFEDFLVLFASFFEGIHIANPEISSDSTTLYLLLLVLFAVALLFVGIGRQCRFWVKHHQKILHAVQLVLVFYLAAIMIRYGTDKLFKAQFYLPEPNALFTPLGMLDKDLLFWSTMGTSHSYNIFMGLCEALPAILLLFRRTRFLGLLVLSGVLLNVVFVNFSFDISVKLFALFLLLMCLLLLVPAVPALYRFFVLQGPAALPPISGAFVMASNPKRRALKAGVLVLLFFETILPYARSQQFNDDLVPRNFLHGAYEVVAITFAEGRPNALEKQPKHVFIHRHNFFIIQFEDDSMEDFYLKSNPATNQMELTNYDGLRMLLCFQYTSTTEILELEFVDLGITITTKTLPWRDLPLLQPLFHWTVDGASAGATTN